MAEKLYKRTGECNQCGECCSDLPWALKPSRVRNWELSRMKLNIPVLQLIPFVKVTGDDNRRNKPKKTHGYIQRGQHVFRYIFADDDLHKDLPPFGDPNTVSRECPFLLPDDGDGKRPCGLYGTKSHKIWENHCQEMSLGVPLHGATQMEIDQWFEDHPSCSFDYLGSGS